MTDDNQRRPRRRALTLLAAASLVVGSMAMAASALALPDAVFELDGNAVSGNATPPADDWDRVCYAVNQLLPAAERADCSTTTPPTGATATSWTPDGIASSIFTGGGSKDPQDISSWLWKDGSVPDKDNLLHAFAVRYQTPTQDVLYFGSDRYANDGDAMQGFWFFQQPVAMTDIASQGGFKFDGAHTLGDLLVISDFSIGGTTSTITVYEWDPACTKAGVIVGGYTCGDQNLKILQSAENANCATSATTAPFCGIVNPTDDTFAPWPFLDKKGNSTYLQGELFEGGIDLYALGLTDRCYASIASETRSSTSTTAVLKDFVLGTFGKCGSELVTTPSVTTAPIGSGASVSVTDSANLTVSGIQSWSGSLKFYLCGPIATGTCDGTTNVGIQVGDTLAVTQATAMPVSSAAATVTSVGRYCWRGEFDSATEGVPDAFDSTEGECFTITPLEPTLTTNATATVEIGNPISDSATLLGTAKQPDGDPAGGTITFTAYGPNDATCTGTPAFTSSAITVSGDDTYNSGDFTPKSAGTYRWVASYTGDSPNTTGPVATACNDENETTTVTPKTPTIVTNATAGPLPLGSAISDTATIGNTANQPDGDPAGGSITFWAYGPDDATCAGTAAFTSTVTVSGDGPYGSGSFTPTKAGTYYWVASYTGDPPNTAGPVATKCGDPNESSVLFKLQPTIATEQLWVPNDAATVAVVAGAGDLAGSIRFRLYDNASCDPIGTTLYDKTFSIAGGTGTGLSRTVTTDNTTAYKVGGTFSWLVEYTSSNTGHENVVSVCNTEHSTLTIDNNWVAP